MLNKISLVLMILIASYGFARAQESALVYPGGDGKLVYVEHANTLESNNDNIIPDFSRSGYMGGGVAIPDVPVKITLNPESGDDRQRIQDAIDYVEGLAPDANGFRGAVLLTAGTYVVDAGLSTGDDALRIEADGVVLRGEGQGEDGTIIKTTFEGIHRMIAIRPNQPTLSTSNPQRITDSYVGAGAKSFNVADAGGFSVGDTIYVTATINQTWLDDIYANDYMGSGDIDWTVELYTMNFERQIAAVNGNEITINSPIIQPMQTRYGGGEIKKLRIASGYRLQQIGVENLRLEGVGVTATAPADDPDRLREGVHLGFTENSWVSGVTVLHSDWAAIRTWSSNYITIQDCASLEPLGPKSGGHRYAFYFDGASSHNLCQRTYSEDGRHDYVLGPRTPGPNVFLDGYSIRGAGSGPHQRWATGTLFDNLKLESLIAIEHRNGSGSGHSWAGVQSIIWNTETPTIICDAPDGFLNYAIGNTGTEVLSPNVDNRNPGVYRGYYDSHGTHVAPRSLYLKQLEDRLGSGAVANVTIPEQRMGAIYELLAAWAGNGPLGPTDPPPAPSALNAHVVTSSRIDLSWVDTYTESGIIVERKEGSGDYVEIATVAANVTSYIDEGLDSASYTYRVSAYNSAGYSDYSNEASASTVGVGNRIDHTDSPIVAITYRAEISSDEGADKAFDNSTATKWLDDGGVPSITSPSWIQIQLSSAVVVDVLSITSANDVPNRDPMDFTLKGSNYGSSWTSLGSWTGQTWHDLFVEKTFGFSNSDGYRYYRLEITKNRGELDMTQLSEIMLIGPEGSVSLPDVANSDIPALGTVTGSYTNTQSSDNVYESIKERESGGKPAKRYSYLEHKWTINVTGGSSVKFYLEAYKTANTEGDDFVFAYSTDDVNYTDMVTVTKTSDDDVYQTFTMPSSLSGTVYIRVKDTDQTQGNRSLDEIFIDHMFIISDSSGGPTQYTLTTNTSGYGSVSLDPSGGIYDDGTNVTVTATPDSGWTFSGWSGDLSGSTNPETITMNSNKTVTATFVESGPVNDVANSDIPASGTVTGSYTDAQSSDNVYESIEERESGGKPAMRYGYLEHKWTINVTGGSSVIFYLEAYKTANTEGDDFVFAYSTDDVNYTDMVTVTKTSDDDAYQTFTMPSSLSGTVYILVKDTDQTQGNRSLDKIFVDHMFIHSDAGLD